MLKLSRERKQNLKTALGWGVVWSVLLTIGLCCAPMSEIRQPQKGRGVYPPLMSVSYGDGKAIVGKCSWGRVDQGTIVTAKHCVSDGQLWLIPELPSAPAVCVDKDRDSAYLLSNVKDGPKARIELPERTPRAGDVVCYDSFYGRHNCGFVQRVFDNRFTMQLQAPVWPGDSGSPIYTYMGTVGVVSGRVDGKAVGTGALLPNRCENQ